MAEAGQGTVLDPYDLPTWVPESEEPKLLFPCGKAGPFEFVYIQTFSMKEKAESYLKGGYMMGLDPHRDARETLHIIAKMMDEKLTYRALIKLQDKYDKFLNIDVIPPSIISSKRMPDSGDPLTLVRATYFDFNPGNSSHEAYAASVFLALLHTQQQGTCFIKCSTSEEMAILKSFFESNHKKLCPKFLKKFDAELPGKLSDVPGSYTSFMIPLYIEVPESMEPKCFTCGGNGKHACGKCKVARYCSRECQKKDWKDGHKKACRVPELAIDSDPSFLNWIDIDPKKSPVQPDMGYFTTSYTSSAKFSLPQFFDPTNIPECVRSNVMMIFKVQISLGSKPADEEPITIYPEGKKFQICCVPKNMAGYSEYSKLHNIVTKFGSDTARHAMGNYKVYLNGYVTKDRILRLFPEQIKPVQQW